MKTTSRIIAPVVIALMIPCALPCQEAPARKISREVSLLHDRVNRLEERLAGKDREICELTEKVSKLGAGYSEAGLLDKVRNRLSFTGDFRLRAESTTHQDDRKSRYRGVVRFRVGMNYVFNDLFKAGVRLTTGSQDDPNSSDVTLGDFLDDLDISLDRLFMNFKYEGIQITGGKFANPFKRTDLVWDGDVNPQGATATYTLPDLHRLKPALSGLLMVIDEQSNGSESLMYGVQASLQFNASEHWNFTLAGSYYDYEIKSLVSADSGDIRSNNLHPNGAEYLSDFDLLDAIAVAEYSGFGERYPLLLVCDYVTNLGAEVDDDQGFSIDFFVGRKSKKNDLRVRYGYSMAETDAVLAAFSHDNTTIPTNYRQHTFGIDYVLMENTYLNLTWYLYRRHSPGNTPTTDSKRYVSRVRLNLSVKF